MDAVDIIDEVSKLKKELLVVRGGDIHDPRFQLHHAAQKNVIMMFSAHLLFHLSSRVVLKEYRLDRKCFHDLLDEIRRRFYHALVTPGEMVGVLAINWRTSDTDDVEYVS